LPEGRQVFGFQHSGAAHHLGHEPAVWPLGGSEVFSQEVAEAGLDLVELMRPEDPLLQEVAHQIGEEMQVNGGFEGDKKEWLAAGPAAERGSSLAEEGLPHSTNQAVLIGAIISARGQARGA
jgi:hypothetical protein